MKIFIWKVCRNSITTRSNLAKWKLCPDGVSYIGATYTEAIVHNKFFKYDGLQLGKATTNSANSELCHFVHFFIYNNNGDEPNRQMTSDTTEYNNIDYVYCSRHNQSPNSINNLINYQQNYGIIIYHRTLRRKANYWI